MAEATERASLDVELSQIPSDILAWLKANDAANANLTYSPLPWVDAGGFVFDVYPLEAGGKMKLMYLPDGKDVVMENRRFDAKKPEHYKVFRALMKGGRVVTMDEFQRLEKKEAVFANRAKKAGGRAKASSTLAFPEDRKLPTPHGGRKRRKPKNKWMPYLIVGGVLAAILVGVTLYRRRQGAALPKEK